MTRSALTHSLSLLSLTAITACHRRTPEGEHTHTAAIDVPQINLQVTAVDRPTPTPVTTDVPAPRDTFSALTEQLPTRPAMSGSWQKLPRVTIDPTAVISRWHEAADVDGDDMPDPMVVLPLDALRCTTVHEDRPCPSPSDFDSPDGTDDIDGPRTLAVVVFHSGDLPRAPNSPSSNSDAAINTTDTPPPPPPPPPPGRLIGLRRVWVGHSLPMSRLATVHFSEFGPGVLVRTTLEITATDRVHDTLDVVDLYTGVGLDRLAGSLVHHCVRAEGQRPVRRGSLSVTTPSLTALVWRAALAHPFSGCDTHADSLDRALGVSLSAGVSPVVTETTNVPPSHSVAFTVTNGVLSFTELTRQQRRATTGDAGTLSNPLSLDGTDINGMSRACSWDFVRARRDGHRCDFRIARRDDPLPHCFDGESPLDPAPPSPIALLPNPIPDAGAVLLFTRGQGLLSARVPDSCHNHRVRAETFSGAITPGLAVSPDGTRVVSANGLDLWLHLSSSDYPVLLNPPGSAIPRGTLRAAAFIDSTHLALVISTALVRITLPDVLSPVSPRAMVSIDPRELRNGLRSFD